VSFVRSGRSPIRRRYPTPTLLGDLPPLRWPCPYQRSIDATRLGDTTPRIMTVTGERSHTELGDRGPAVQDHLNGNGVGTYAGVAVTAADVPSGFVADPPTSAVDSYNQVQATLQSRQFAPPQCGTVSAVTAASAPLGLEVSFYRNSTKESLGKFLAPAGNPRLTDLQSVAESCGTVTASDPAKSLQLGGGVVVVPAPHVAADRTLGLQTTTIATVTGKPAVTGPWLPVLFACRSSVSKGIEGVALRGRSGVLGVVALRCGR